ncbi:MAG: nitrite reductase [Candidatus Pristimantibacillus lignocellulolyticus]|uniref:Nitrite reductase n=1 Tax=Candidatus Pristimantibacillus lignocellulolyticus TaxID=2994561 RepID=A0A9J6Z8V8_9BACL|nr:MAG: nitrite reductase [Candidatus Pristimantibacillus lignocellulolyticus]
MDDKIKIAVTPPIQLGGSIFTPEQLVTIGNVASMDSTIEMTNFQQLYMEVPLQRRDEIKDQLERSGLEVYPTGFVSKSLIVCNFCRGAEDSGLATAQLLNQAIAGIDTPTPLKIGYAGCALGTSEPLLKDIAVIKMRDTFDIYVGGEPKGLKTLIAQQLVVGLKEEQLVPIINAIIHFYKANAKGKEKFSKFVHRMTIEQLQQLAG